MDGRYAAVPYLSLPHRASDPDRAAVLAHLHGLVPPDVGRSRIVELACGDGGNLLSIAAARPQAELLGFDLEETAIARGRELATEAGLDRVDLRAADIRDLRAQDVGEADYVIAHGLLSWAPADVREATFALVGEILDEDGIFIVSYNSLPGWYPWLAARDIAQRATADEIDGERAAQVAIAAVREAAQLHRRDDAYGQALMAAVRRYEKLDPWMLFHDDLNPHCTPFSVSQVAAQAGRHGMRYLAEVMPESWWQWTAPPQLAERLRGGEDPVARQQVADFVSGVDFKSTLLVSESARPSPDPDLEAALELEIGRLPHASELGGEAAPQGRQLFEALDPSETGELSLPLSEAASRARLKPKQAIPAAFRLVVDGQATLRRFPPEAVVRAGERPRSPALARAQARRTDLVSTLTHDRVQLRQPAVRALVGLLDGSRTRGSLPRELAAAGPEWGFDYDETRLAGALEGLLARLGAHGLLEA